MNIKERKNEIRKKAFLGLIQPLLVAILGTWVGTNCSSKMQLFTTEGLKATTANFVLSGINEDMSNISGYKSQINLNIWRPYTAVGCDLGFSNGPIASNRNAPRHGRSGNGYNKNILSLFCPLLCFLFWSPPPTLCFGFLGLFARSDLRAHRSEYC